MDMMGPDSRTGICGTTYILNRRRKLPEISLHILPGPHIFRFFLNPVQSARNPTQFNHTLNSSAVQRIKLFNPDNNGIVTFPPDTLFLQFIIYFSTAEKNFPGSSKITPSNDTGLKSPPATIR